VQAAESPEVVSVVDEDDASKDAATNKLSMVKACFEEPVVLESKTTTDRNGKLKVTTRHEYTCKDNFDAKDPPCNHATRIQWGSERLRSI
jgi:hypothetical protein